MSKDTQDKTVDALQDLLTRAYDAEQGFEKAAESVDHPRLRDLLMEYSAQRRSFGHDIKEFIRANGEEPDKGASLTGKLHQFWIDMRGKLTDGNEADIIEECRRGEETTMSDYQAFVDDEDLLPSARQLFREQLEKIREIYSRLTNLEDAAATADAAAR